MRCIVALDLDYFYCQVEIRQRRELNEHVPIAVFQKNLIATCNYPARRAGVEKLTSVETALKKCPELKLLDGSDLTPYRKANERLFTLLKNSLGTAVERLGLDEFFLDVTELVQERVLNAPVDWKCHFQGYCWPLEKEEGFISSMEESEQCFAVATQICQEVRELILQQLEYTCSGGIGPNKLFAKLATKLHKPGGQTLILPSVSHLFLKELDLRSIPGIGTSTYNTLYKHFSVHTCEELQLIPVGELERLFGNRTGTFLFCICRGIDEEPVKDSSVLQSISCEDSFQNLCDWNELHLHVNRLVEKLLDRIAEQATRCPGRYPKTYICAYRQGGSVRPEVFSHRASHDLIRFCFGYSSLDVSIKENTYKLSELRRSAWLELTGYTKIALEERLGRDIYLKLVRIGVKDFIVQKEFGLDESNSIAHFFRSSALDKFKSLDILGGSEEHIQCCICENNLGHLSNNEINCHIDNCLRTSETGICDNRKSIYNSQQGRKKRKKASVSLSKLDKYLVDKT
eukprot:jgi/Galph1/5021/GphlegSOOS_G3608.1